MRLPDEPLASHLQQTTKTLATCWLIQLLDGTYEAYTNHDRQLVFAGFTFLPKGVSETATSSKITIETDNLEVHGLVDPSSSFATINSRKYDGARISVFRVNYKSLPSEITRTSVLWIKKGVTGDVFFQRGSWVLEVRGFRQLLKQATGTKTSRLCKAEFGDANCRADLNLYSHTGTVTSYTSKSIITDISGLANDAAKQGKVTFDLSGIAYDIISSNGGTFILTEELDFDPTGLDVTVIQGCNKWLTDCAKYKNVVNYFGEPYVPTEDEWASGYFDTIIG